MKPSIQVPLPGLPFDPAELAKLSIIDRAAVYDQHDLHPIERQAAEAGVRAILSGRYRRGAS